MTVFVIISFVIDDFSVQKNGKKTPPLQEVTRQKNNPKHSSLGIRCATEME